MQIDTNGLSSKGIKWSTFGSSSKVKIPKHVPKVSLREISQELSEELQPNPVGTYCGKCPLRHNNHDANDQRSKSLEAAVRCGGLAPFLTPLVQVVFFLFKQVFSNSTMSVCHFTLTVVTEQQQLLQQQHFRKCETDVARCEVVLLYDQVPQHHTGAPVLVSVYPVSRNHQLQDEACQHLNL